MSLLRSILIAAVFFPLCLFSRSDTLIVGYNSAPPFVVETNEELTGPVVWLWEHIAADLDFAYEYRHTSLDSMIHFLGTGQIDIAASPLTITSVRAESFDFTAPFYITHSTFAIREVSPLSKWWQFISSFFSVNFFRALGALVVVILIFGGLEWFFERKANKEEFGEGLKGLWHGFWWSAVTMTTVGYGDKSPKTVGGRVVALIWMFTAIMIISGFTASIASSLTVKEVNDSSASVSSFKDQTIGTVASSGTEEWLKDHFFKKRVVYKDIYNCYDALLAKEVDAVAFDEPILRDVLSRDSIENVQLLNLPFNAQHYALGLNRQLGDSLKRQINISLLSQVERKDWTIVLSEHDLE